MISDDDNLEGDTLKWLKEHTADGGYFDATTIGVSVGFDRSTAASKMRGTLLKLIREGKVEQERTGKPIIYRATNN